MKQDIILNRCHHNIGYDTFYYETGYYLNRCHPNIGRNTFYYKTGYHLSSCHHNIGKDTFYYEADLTGLNNSLYPTILCIWSMCDSSVIYEKVACSKYVNILPDQTINLAGITCGPVFSSHSFLFH